MDRGAVVRTIAGTVVVAVLTLLHQPGSAQPTDAEPSPLEVSMSRRAGTRLRLHGYDRLPIAAPVPSPLLGAIGDGYELGIGDVLAVTLRGRRDADVRTTVDSAGMVVVEGLRPVPAAGRSLGEVRIALATEARIRLTETDAVVSLAEARQITVNVLGEVAAPGRRTVGAFSGPLDAIGAAGGILRSGSLRRVTLVRAGVTTAIDLYGFLDGSGDVAEMRLRDGDRIVVPRLGPTTAVAGSVDRQGIFELSPDRSTLADLAARAGGPEGPRRLRWTRLTFDADGRERAEDVDAPAAVAVARDDILFVVAREDVVRDRVTVTGHVRDPGPRARGATGGLGALARSLAFLPDPYLPFAAIETTDPATRRLTLVPVDLAAAIDGRADPALRDDDRLIVLGMADVEFLASRAVLALFGDRPDTGTAGRCAGLDALARQIAADGRGPLAAGRVALAARDLHPPQRPCPSVFDRHPDLLPLAMRHAALLRRGAERPGLYPVLSATGDGDLRPGAVVDAPFRSIVLEGAVRAPGARSIDDGPSLSHLIGRTADLSRDAYLLLGVVERIDPATGTHRTIPFVPRAVLDGTDDLALADGDTVLILSESFVHAMSDAEGPGTPESVIPPWLRDRWVMIHGAVARPGRLPIGGSVALTSLVEAAGGPTPSARTDVVHVTSGSGVRTVDLSTVPPIPVGPGEAVRIAAREDAVLPAAVAVEGAVRWPGRYDMRAGDTVADLLDRAGGPAPFADRRGLVIVRAAAVDRTDGPTRLLIGAAEDGSGPATTLEPGDRLVMPVRRSDVVVAGAVHAPAAVPYTLGQNAAAYVAAAGGPTRFADIGAIRVVLPDGRSRPVGFAGADAVPSGSTIVVPRDPRVPDVRPAARLLDAILARIGGLDGAAAAAP